MAQSIDSQLCLSPSFSTVVSRSATVSHRRRHISPPPPSLSVSVSLRIRLCICLNSSRDLSLNISLELSSFSVSIDPFLSFSVSVVSKPSDLLHLKGNNIIDRIFCLHLREEITKEGLIKHLRDAVGDQMIRSIISQLPLLQPGNMGIKVPGRPNHEKVSESAEISAQESNPCEVQIKQLPSTTSGILSSSATVQGLNKHPEQHMQLPSSSPYNKKNHTQSCTCDLRRGDLQKLQKLLMLVEYG